MDRPRLVFLDPDATGGRAWLYALVHAPTGIVCQSQYGGLACRQGRAEGCLVPLHAPAALHALRRLFEQAFRGAGTHGRPWSAAQRTALREAVTGIRFRACDGSTETPHPLRPDDTLLHEADEAWIP